MGTKDAKFSPEELFFDKKNPRFTDEFELDTGSETEVIRHFYELADLNELIQSISSSGYQNYEPLVILEEDGKKIVLEGNRRLAAVKVLRDSKLRKAIGLDLGDPSPEVLASMNEITVKIVSSRAEARAYIGFKHINGPHKWDALAKAKFAAEWLSDGGNIETVSRPLGDSHNTVVRLVNGLNVLNQAKRSGFDLQDRSKSRFFFSHLYTALSRAGFKEYLGLSDEGGLLDIANPIDEDHIPQLLEVMSWLYGQKSKDEVTVIRSQNPDLNRLNDILVKREAKVVLSAKRDLDLAYEKIQPPGKQFEDALLKTVTGAEGTLGLVSSFDGDAVLYDTAERLQKTVKILFQAMKAVVGDNDGDQ